MYSGRTARIPVGFGDAVTSPAQRSSVGAGSVAAVLAGALFMALALGLGAATGQRLVIIGMAGLLAGLAVLAVPAVWTLWTMVLASMVVVGPVTYFLKLGQTQWLPALLGLALFVQVLLLLLKKGPRTPGMSPPAFLHMLLLFWVGATASSVMAGASFGELLMASRYYLFVWGALMVFAVGAVDAQTIDRLWKALLVIALLQFPLALYQYLFVASKRATGELLSGGAPPWDAIVGTFPGTDTGGGNSAAMAFFLLVIIVMAIALWRTRHLSGLKTFVVVTVALAAISLAEVKAVVLLIPVALALYYRREIARRPLEALFALLAAVALAGSLLAGYQTFHYDKRQIAPKAANAGVTVYERILNQVDPEAVNESNERIGRVAHLVMWWDLHVKGGDWHRGLMGHGIGATQASNFEVGTLFRRFGQDIGRSSMVLLLWEVGAVGLLLFSGILASGAWLSHRLAKDERIPSIHRVYLAVGAIGLVLAILTLPYKPFAMRLTSIQLLIILMLGQTWFWRRQLYVLSGRAFHKSAGVHGQP